MRMRIHTATDVPLVLVPGRVAATMCGKSLRTWRAWDAGGRIPRPVRVGRSTLWRVEELHAWIAAGCPTREHWEAIYGRQTPCGVARAEHTVSRAGDSILDPR